MRVTYSTPEAWSLNQRKTRVEHIIVIDKASFNLYYQLQRDEARQCCCYAEKLSSMVVSSKL